MQISISDIKPKKNFIVVDPKTSRPEETTTGFVMPEERYTPTPVIGTVLAVGPESEFHVGEVVFFRRFAIDELKFDVDGKKQVVSLISDDEVVAVVKKDA